MAKKLSFNDLPATLEKILEILSSGGSEHTALPELIQRFSVVEKRLDKIEQILSPNRPTMDKHTVMRVLKVRPKILNEMENSGVLISHSEGRRKFYYEDDVVKCYVNQSSWKNLLGESAKPEPAEPAESVVSENGTLTEGGLIGIDAAIELLGRKKLTIYKLTSQNKIPFIRKGNKLFFEVEKLEQWKAKNSSRQRKSSNETDNSDSIEGQDFVDIYGASKILGRTPGAIRQHMSSLPHHKAGNKLYFDTKELEAWAKTHPPRKRKSKNNEAETA